MISLKRESLIFWLDPLILWFSLPGLFFLSHCPLQSRLINLCWLTAIMEVFFDLVKRVTHSSRLKYSESSLLLLRILESLFILIRCGCMITNRVASNKLLSFRIALLFVLDHMLLPLLITGLEKGASCCISLMGVAHPKRLLLFMFTEYGVRSLHILFEIPTLWCRTPRWSMLLVENWVKARCSLGDVLILLIFLFVESRLLLCEKRFS